MNDFIANLPLSLSVKEFWKSVNIWLTVYVDKMWQVDEPLNLQQSGNRVARLTWFVFLHYPVERIRWQSA